MKKEFVIVLSDRRVSEDRSRWDLAEICQSRKGSEGGGGGAGGRQRNLGGEASWVRGNKGGGVGRRGGGDHVVDGRWVGG